MTKMDDTDLSAIISQEINNSIGYDGSTTSYQRTNLYDLYLGGPLGNTSDPTRSQIVDRTALNVVEWSIPNLRKVFTASDKLFEFEPTRPDQAETAMAATEYVNYIFMQDNRGEQILDSWMRTALIQRNSYILCRWVEDRDYEMSTFTGLEDHEYQAIVDSPNIEIVEEAAYPNPDPMLSGFNQDAASVPDQGQPPENMLHDVRVKVWRQNGRVKIDHIAPENIMISRRCTDVILDGSSYVGYRDIKTVSDLRVMGIDEDIIEEAKQSSQPNWSVERMSRYEMDGGLWPDNSGRTDESMVDITLEFNFLRVDRDGDGIAELRYVLTAGNGSVILIDEEIDEVPIIALCPIPQPYKHQGLGLVDLVADLQQLKTIIIQQTVDSLMLSTTPRIILNEQSMSENTLDDLNNDFAGAALRVRDNAAVTPFVIPFVGQQSLGVLEYLDQVQADRTGISRNNNGLDPDVENVTASGIAMKMNAANQRLEYIARVFADQIRVLGERILGLVTKHQQEARILRITGQFVEFDPRNWKGSYDCTCTSAIGTGDKTQIVQNAGLLAQMQERIVSLQGGVSGPLVTAQNVYDLACTIERAMGFRTKFFSDPSTQPPQQEGQKQDPEMMKAQAEIQIAQMKLQAQIQADQKQAELQAQLRMQEAQLDAQLKEQEYAHKVELEDRDAQHQQQLEQQRETFKSKIELARLAQTAMQSQAKSNVAGARQAPDGNHYVSDPNRPGRYMMVV